MSEIYIVEGGGGGRCRCGHRSRSGEDYMLIEGVKGDWTLCFMCFVEKGMKGKRVRIEELMKKWFKGKTPTEVMLETVGV